MSEMSYDSDMFESSSKRQPSNTATSLPRKSIMKPKKNLDEIWLEGTVLTCIQQIVGVLSDMTGRFTTL